MTNEELILERLDRIERRIDPLTESALSMKEFKDDLLAMSQPISKSLIKELEDVESSFQLEDLTAPRIDQVDVSVPIAADPGRFNRYDRRRPGLRRRLDLANDLDLAGQAGQGQAAIGADL